MELSARLSTPDGWSSQWGKADTAAEAFVIDPKASENIEFHQLMMAHLPHGPQYRAIEIGCFPGQYMRYLREQYGYQISGIEYVEPLAEQAKKRFEQEGIDAEIIAADVFRLSARCRQTMGLSPQASVSSNIFKIAMR